MYWLNPFNSLVIENNKTVKSVFLKMKRIDGTVFVDMGFLFYDEKANKNIFKYLSQGFEKNKEGQFILPSENLELLGWMEMPSPHLPTKSVDKYKEKRIIFDFGYASARVVKDYPTLQKMGITDLNYCEYSNILYVTLMHPGILIGKGGKTIDAIEDDLRSSYEGIRIEIKENKTVDTMKFAWHSYFGNS